MPIPEDVKESFEAWLAERPECVRKLAAEFPPGTRIFHRERIWWLLGYTESDELIITDSSPFEDYDKAVEAKKIVHAQCIRDNFTRNNPN